MSTITSALGDLRVVRVFEEHAVLPCLVAADPDGRALLARVLPASRPLDAAQLERFRSSLEAAAQVQHPCVDAPLTWGVSPMPYVATAAAHGLALSALSGPSPEAVLAIAIDVAEALEATHAAGAVHGGTSLAAVRLREGGRAVLGDFGIRALAAELVGEQSSFLGSVTAHMTPEQVNDATVTAAGDVFSLGAMLYRLLSGSYPFDAPSPMGMTLRLSMGAFEPLGPQAPGAPAQLCEVVHRMLSTDPSARPTARDVVVALLPLAPQEAARRAAIGALVPPAPAEALFEVAAPPRPAPEGAPSMSKPLLEREAPPFEVPPPEAPAAPTFQAAAPGRRASKRPNLREIAEALDQGPVDEWQETARFEDGAATEFAPELAAAIAKDAGITNPVVISGAVRPRGPRAVAPSPAAPIDRGPPRGAGFYALVAGGVLLLLLGLVGLTLILVS